MSAALAVGEEGIKEGTIAYIKGNEAVKVEETVEREKEERETTETRVSKRKGDDVGRVKYIHDVDHGAAAMIAIVDSVVVVARVDTLVVIVVSVVGLTPSKGDDKSIFIFETAVISLISSSHLSSLVDSSRLASCFVALRVCVRVCLCEEGEEKKGRKKGRKKTGKAVRQAG